MKLDKKHWTIIGIIVLAIIAFFTRKYWLPAYGKINIKSVDWDNKKVDYSLILQGQDSWSDTAVFGKDENSIPRYQTKGKNFTFTKNSGTDNGDYILFTLYKGSLEGKATADYEILDQKLVSFNNKTITDVRK